MRLKSPNIIIAVLIFSALVATFNETLLNVALIPIADEMNVSSATAQWLVTGYMLVTSIMVPVTAFLYLSVRTKVLHLTALCIVLAGTLGCLFSVSFPMLLACRMLQAAGTGMMIPIMMNVTMQIAPKEKLTVYLALCSAAVTVGPALGPTISGVIMQHFTWRASFVLITVLVLAAIILSAVIMRNVAELTHPHLDIISVVLSSGGLAFFLLGISLAASNPLRGIVFIGAGVAIIAAFAVRQNHLEEPMLNLTPFKNATFVFGLILVFIPMLINFSLNAVMPSYLQGALGVSSMVSALILLPGVLGNAGSTLLSGKIMAKRGVRVMLPVGFSVFTLGVLLLSFCKTSVAIPVIILIHIFLYQGLAFTQSPAQTTALEALPKELYPHGVSLTNTFMQVAAAVGSSLFGGIRSSVQAADLSAGIASNIAAADGFSAALHVAVMIGVAGLVITFIFNRRVNGRAHKETAKTLTFRQRMANN